MIGLNAHYDELDSFGTKGGTMAELSQDHLHELRALLRGQQATLRQSIARELAQTGDSSARALASRLHDGGDDAVADLLADLDIAGLESQAHSLADVEGALARLEGHRYGVCTECGGPVGLARLRAYPTAKRCYTCQERHEHLARDRTPSL